MNRFKSYSFWVSLSSAVILLSQNIASLFGFTFETSLIENVIMAICGLLVVLGIVKKPKQTTQVIETVSKVTETLIETPTDQPEEADQTNTQPNNITKEQNNMEEVLIAPKRTAVAEQIVQPAEVVIEEKTEETPATEKVVEKVECVEEATAETDNVEEVATPMEETKPTEIVGELVNENGVQYVKIRCEFLQNLYSNNENN